MAGAMDIKAIQALANLVRQPNDNDSDSDEEKPTTSPYTKLGPGHIGPAKKQEADKETNEKPKTDPNDIWGDDEVHQGAEFDDLDDPRPQPEYEFIYKQAVHSEDMYLQMSNKSPATASCEELKVRITLPDTKGSDIFLDVKRQFLDLRAPKYKLGLHLPHPVDHKSGKAEWDKTKETLTVTLKLKRDLDFVNF